MKTGNPIATAIGSVLLGLGLVFTCLGVFNGCAVDRVAAPERIWEEVRYHWSGTEADGEAGDLTIRSSGEMVWDLRGQRASTRGLLAGENLETLARLIDALPPAGYQDAGSCGRVVFVSVTTPEGRVNYATGDCDTAIPAELLALITHFDQWVADLRNPRPEPVAFRTIAQGSRCRLVNPTRRIATNRDELISLIDAVGEGLGVIPVVDFRREVVVGIFMGTCPSEGYGVEVTSAHRSGMNQVVLHESRVVPGAECRFDGTGTSPFAVVAVAAGKGEDVLNEVETVVQACGGER
jgi:hypothetical protein